MAVAPRAYRPHNFRALSKPKPVNKQDHKHYWPYIPVLLIVFSTFLISLVHPVQHRGVLAYATNMSASGLLQATNQQRVAAGVGSLAINSQLTQAATAKANDMIARNYWSHNTPDGKEPWVFINNAGYSYLKAGENLAYGFETSSDAITGWMNSPAHKANLLDSSFTDVGFGFANGADYNSSGNETVVVAMYGKPQVLAASSTAPVTPAAPAASTPAPVAANPQAATPQPVIADSTVPVAATKPADKPVTTETAVTEPATQHISRVQSLTGGQMPWLTFAVGIITGLALTALLIKHAAGLRHLLRDGEKFVLQHPLLDTILVSLVLAGTFLSQTTGFIK